MGGLGFDVGFLSLSPLSVKGVGGAESFNLILITSFIKTSSIANSFSSPGSMLFSSVSKKKKSSLLLPFINFLALLKLSVLSQFIEQ